MSVVKTVEVQLKVGNLGTFTGEMRVASNEVSAFGKSAEQGAQQAAKGLQTSNEKLKAFGNDLTQTGKAMSLGITAPLVAIGAKAVSTAADFEKSMNTMKAVAGVPGPELQKLSDLAIKLGADTTFSANEAAEGMLELAKAGISTADIMGGGLKNALDLATAGDLALAEASTVTANAMSVFALSGEESQRAVDALAGAANASSADVSDLAQALAQGGLAAANAGLSIEETTATLAAFADAGLKGSDAGTSMKTMLLNLIPTTKKQIEAMEELDISFANADGSFKSITEIAEILKTKLGGLSDAQRTVALETIFGSDAIRAATVLMNEGASGLQKYIDETSKAGTAAEVANAKMQGLPGTIEKFKGSVETAALALGNALAPAITVAAEALAALADGFTSLPEPVQTTIVVLGSLAAAAGPVLIVLGSMAKAAAALKVAFGGAALASSLTGMSTAAGAAATSTGALAASGGLLGKTIAGLTSPIGLATTALALFVTQTEVGKEAFGLFKEDLKETGNGLAKIAERFGIGADSMSEKIQKINPAVASLVKAWEEANQAIASGFIKTGEVTQESVEKVTAAANLTRDEVVKAANETAEGLITALTHSNEETKALTEEQVAHARATIIGEKEDAIATAEERRAGIIAKVEELRDQGIEVTKEMVDGLIAEDQRLLTSSLTALEENKTKRLELLELIRTEAGQISEETASKIIGESARTRDETIKAAEEQYRTIVSEAVKLREAGVISEEESTKMIDAAKRTKEETTLAARDGHTEVVSEVRTMGEESVTAVNTATGEMKTGWEQAMETIAGASETAENETGSAFGNMLTRVKDFVFGSNAQADSWKERLISSAGAIGKAIDALPKVKSIEISAVDKSTSTIESIKKALASITDKTVTVNTIHKDTQNIGNQVGSKHRGGLILHSGGPVPRLHSGGGGQLGLRADERMAILQTDEFVFSRQATRQIGVGNLERWNANPGAWSSHVQDAGGRAGGAGEIAGLFASLAREMGAAALGRRGNTYQIKIDAPQASFNESSLMTEMRKLELLYGDPNG